jgi:hypothetical protein
MEMPEIIKRETEDDAVANLTLQLVFQAIRYLDSEVMTKRNASEIDNMFDGLITTEEPTYNEEATCQQNTESPSEMSSGS